MSCQFPLQLRSHACIIISFQLAITLVCNLSLFWLKIFLFLEMSFSRVPFSVAWTLLSISQYVSLKRVWPDFRYSFTMIPPRCEEKHSCWWAIFFRSYRLADQALTPTFSARIVVISPLFMTIRSKNHCSRCIYKCIVNNDCCIMNLEMRAKVLICSVSWSVWRWSLSVTIASLPHVKTPNHWISDTNVTLGDKWSLSLRWIPWS